MSAATIRRLDAIAERLAPDVMAVIRQPGHEASEADHRAFAAMLDEAKSNGERVILLNRHYGKTD